jgi:hypothetical protein
MSGSVDNRRMEEESRLTPFEIFQTRYIHLQVCSPDHPLFKKYHQEFKKVTRHQRNKSIFLHHVKNFASSQEI